MKKIGCVFIVLLFALFPINTSSNFSFASASEEEFNEVIDEQLGNLDTDEIDKIFENLDDETKEIFGDESFLDKVKKIISGEVVDDSENILEYVLNLVFAKLLSFLPLISMIIGVAILGSIMQGIKPKTNGKSVSSVVNFVTYGVIVILIFSILGRLISSVMASISSLKGQMDAVFPVLLTLLTSMGGSVSVGIYQPAMAILSSIVINIFTVFLLPLFILSCILVLLNNMSNSIKLNKMIDFFNSLIKWTIGIVFTIFMGFASLQGLTAGSVDGLSIKTAKYTLKSYIPIVGGYMSDGLFLVLAGCNLIKNAVGMCGVLLMFSSLIAPLIEIIVFMLALKLVSAVVEPIGDSKSASLISGIAKNMQIMTALLVSVSFMYILLTGLVMCSANVI